MNRLKSIFIILPLVINCANLNMNNQPIEVTGIAQNAKLGAVVETGDAVYYIDKLRYWNELTGKRIRVKGILHLVEVKAARTNENGIPVEQGFSEDTTQKIIKNAKWEILD